jgi:hypothetical protein
MKMYGGVEIYLYPFLTLALDALVHRFMPHSLLHGKELWYPLWVDLRPSLDKVVKRTSFCHKCLVLEFKVEFKHLPVNMINLCQFKEVFEQMNLLV